MQNSIIAMRESGVQAACRPARRLTVRGVKVKVAVRCASAVTDMASQQAQQALSGEGRVKRPIVLIERQVKSNWQKLNSAITRRSKARSAGSNARCNRKTLFAKSNGMPSMFRPEKSAV